jgi:hypothetical protein
LQIFPKGREPKWKDNGSQYSHATCRGGEGNIRNKWVNRPSPHERVLSISNYQINADQNHNEAAPHSTRLMTAYIKEMSGAGAAVEKLELWVLWVALSNDVIAIERSVEGPQKS